MIVDRGLSPVLQHSILHSIWPGVEYLGGGYSGLSDVDEDGDVHKEDVEEGNDAGAEE